ncbi:MAG: class II fructose-bisphosphatase [Anaerolineae bacterium]|nr:class II fructose-bisphosphatase [Anaerolineae bacterium]MCB9133320.1 class II fructose-bisphosphatase [Anaerolineales bacterium]MCB0229589.1 class II fructose-bisphosphatase [Anaerolineae bacterium]MCB0236271.1 class II fructose-bisphosphatase [Anaerolineae bacterium]MCB0243527.1 class II fructose-bisphosphatase [Anaerolineae bacterium]
MTSHPPRNLGLDLVRATEAAALAAARWMGVGKPDEADQAAAEAMYGALNTLDMQGRIVVGEEGKLGVHSPLDSGRMVGTGNGPEVDVVVDPVDGRRRLAQGHSDAISVVGVAPRDSMWSPSPAVYMEKIVVDRAAADAMVPECIDAPAAWTLALVARVKKKPVRDLVVFVLERPRHEHLVEEIRSAGARVLLRSDGDIAGAMMAAHPLIDVDLLMGAGGIAEGVIAACVVKALGGMMLGRLAPQTEEEWAAVRAAGLDTKAVLSCGELVRGNEIFFAATGITDGLMLEGVRLHGSEAETESIVLRAETGTRRKIHTVHRLTD